MRGGRPIADLRHGRMWVEGRAIVSCGRTTECERKD